MISKQQYEAQLQQIFRLLLENKTQEEIAQRIEYFYKNYCSDTHQG